MPRQRLPQNPIVEYFHANDMYGERVADFFRRDKDSLVPRSIRVSRLTLTDRLAEQAYRAALYADFSDADVELARSLLTPEPSLPALTRLRLSEQNYGSVRRHYIELTNERSRALGGKTG